MQRGLICLAILSLVALPSRGQDLGISIAKTDVAREAGIGSYRLVDNGGVITATVWDADGDDLGECVVEIQKRIATAECDMGEEGRFRWKADKAEEVVTFEDLVSGELVTVKFMMENTLPESGYYIKPGEQPPHEKKSFIVEGSKTLEEMDRDWGEIGRLIGLIVGEVMWSLDLHLSSQGGGPGLATPPSGVYELCDPATSRWSCQTRFGVPGRGRFETEGRCCSVASRSADFTCGIVTDKNCCANSFCTIDCQFGFCNCDLSGFPWECVLCD